MGYFSASLSELTLLAQSAPGCVHDAPLCSEEKMPPSTSINTQQAAPLGVAPQSKGFIGKVPYVQPHQGFTLDSSFAG